MRSHSLSVDLISCPAGVSPSQNIFTLCWKVRDPLVTEFSFWVRYSDPVLFYYVVISTFSQQYFLTMLSSEYILHLLKKQVHRVVWTFVWVLIYYIELFVCFRISAMMLLMLQVYAISWNEVHLCLPQYSLCSGLFLAIFGLLCFHIYFFCLWKMALEFYSDFTKFFCCF